jgi:hypothetical protein
MPEETLNYRSPRDDTLLRKPSARQIGLGLLILLGSIVVGWILLVGATGAQFRLDTGDWRYTYFGIPGNTRRMPEPERSTILSLAAGSAVLKSEWVSVPHHQGPDSQGCFKIFYRAARWARVNRQMSQALLEDAARYVTGPRPPQTPTFLDVILRFEPAGPGLWIPVWPGREKEVVDYLKSKGLPIPSTAPGATTSPATLPPQA